MGLMDKVKAQATQVAAKAQEAGKVGQAKLEAVQAKRKADTLLTELGTITFEAKVGRGTAGDDKRAAELVEQLRQYEAEYGSIGEAPVVDETVPTAPGAPPSSDAGPAPSAGGFPEASTGGGEL